MSPSTGKSESPFRLDNDKSYEYKGPNGTKFIAKRRDFVGGVILALPDRALTQEQIVQDVTAAIGYHATNIWPNLTGGFPGYDLVQYVIQK